MSYYAKCHFVTPTVSKGLVFFGKVSHLIVYYELFAFIGLLRIHTTIMLTTLCMEIIRLVMLVRRRVIIFGISLIRLIVAVLSNALVNNLIICQSKGLLMQYLRKLLIRFEA